MNNDRSVACVRGDCLSVDTANRNPRSEYTSTLSTQRFVLQWGLILYVRKDKTLVEILNRLASLEGKLEQLPNGPDPTGFGPPKSAPHSQPSFSTSSPRETKQPGHRSIGRREAYRNASAPNKILTWPAIQQLLLQALPADVGDWESLHQDGPAFLTRIQEKTPKLAMDECLQEEPLSAPHLQASRTVEGARVTFPYLTRDIMDQLATAYFDTFNLIYPFLDRQYFISDTLGKVHAKGFNGDPDSIIALLIFALGEMAIEGSRGNPIEVHHGRPSGVRGGTTPTKPPGLALFNEARKRIGFVFADYDLENIQIYSLAACVMSPTFEV